MRLAAPFRQALLVAMLALVAWAGRAEADQAADEYRVKAAFLYHFFQYVDWPAASFADAQAPISVCLMGKDPFGEHLNALAQRNFRGRPISVSVVRSLAEAKRCHLLYSDDWRNTGVAGNIDKALQGAPVLTVSSLPNASESGAVIGFVVAGDRVRWTVNLDAARGAKLKLSAKLIEIAVAVVGEARVP
jgi:hypothetical protein